MDPRTVLRLLQETKADAQADLNRMQDEVEMHKTTIAFYDHLIDLVQEEVATGQ
jgi:hypothetical protein